MGGPTKPKSRSANLFISLSTFFFFSFSLQWIQLMQSRILQTSPTFITCVDASAIAKFWGEMAPVAKISPSPSLWMHARTSKIKSLIDKNFIIPFHFTSKISSQESGVKWNITIACYNNQNTTTLQRVYCMLPNTMVENYYFTLTWHSQHR